MLRAENEIPTQKKSFKKNGLVAVLVIFQYQSSSLDQLLLSELIAPKNV